MFQRILRRELLLPWLAGASSLAYVLICFVPWKPPKSFGSIEDSWMLALHAAFQAPLQFGSDIVFTFGPWGFLYGGYYPATHVVAVLAWTLLSGVFWWVAWRTARHFFKNELVSWLWLMALIATTNTTLFLNIDVRLTAFVLLLLVWHFFVEDRVFSASEAMLMVSLGLLSLIKFSFMVYVATVVSVVALDLVIRQRRFPWQVPLYGMSLLVFWSLAGQRLNSIGPYLANSSRVAGGFNEAMMLSGPKELQDVCLFLAAAALLSAPAGHAAWKRHGRTGALFLVAWVFSLFVAFKYGYVRHDGHEVTAVLDLLVMTLLCLALLWPRVRMRGWSVVLPILMLPLAVGVFAATTFARHAEEGWPVSRLRMLQPEGDGKTLRDAYEEFLAQVRNKLPLPRFAGATDAYPWNQAVVFAHGLPLRSRPVIHSYCAFTPELAELNAAFLRGGAAPENIVFQVASVDDRYPSMDDGLSWPELLTRYDLQDVQIPFVLMKRSPSPRRFELTLLREVTLAFGEQLDVPSTADGPVWAEIDLARTVVGSMVSALYKPGELRLNVSVRDGRQFAKRLVPSMTKSGFLLSPFVDDSESFASLAGIGWLRDLAGDEVTAFSVTQTGGASALSTYRGPVSVRLYRLQYPGQDVWSVTGFQQLAHLKRALRDATYRAARPPQLIYAPGAGTILDVPRHSAVLIRPPQGAQRLKLKFGIGTTDASAQAATKGIVFQLSFVDAVGQAVPLWSQQIDAATPTSDPGTHEAAVDLQGVRSPVLILETRPVGSSTGDTTTAYWSDIDFELGFGGGRP